MKEKIVSAAVLYNGVFYTGVRHSEIFSELTRLGHDGPFLENKGYYQGFVSSDNKFYDRIGSKVIVETSGQQYNPHASVLTSEDLW